MIKLELNKIAMPVSIYLMCLGIALGTAFYSTHFAISPGEYKVYQMVIEHGGWQYLSGNILNSCLTVTLFPGYLQMLTVIDDLQLLKFYLSVFYAVPPVFIYLIARKYTNTYCSLLASIFFILSVYYLYPGIQGRLIVSLAFLSVTIWGLLERRYIFVGVFALLLVFTHYGVAFIVLFLMGIVWLYLLIIRRFNIDFKKISVILAIMCLSVYVWHFVIAEASGRVVWEFINTSFSGKVDVRLMLWMDIGGKLSFERIKEGGSFWSLASRDPRVQVALGKGLPYMSVLQRVVFSIHWLMVILVSLGLFYALLKRKVTETYSILAACSYYLVLIVIILPYVSMYFGITRAYIVMLITLAPLLIIFTVDLSRRMKIEGWILPTIIIFIYGLVVSGVVTRYGGIPPGVW